MKTKQKDFEFIKFCVDAKIKSYYDAIDLYSREIKKHEGKDIAYTYRDLRLMFKKHLRTAQKVKSRLPQFLLT